MGGGLEDAEVKECEIIPHIERENSSSTSEASLEKSTSSDEKLSKDWDVVNLANASRLEQQTSPAVREILDELELRLVEDGYVKWKISALAHPRNWSAARKTYDTGLVLLLDLFTWVAQS